MRIATLDEGRPEGRGHLWSIFHERMSELGYTEGRGYEAERYWGNGDPRRLESLAAQIVARRPDAIASAGTPSALALKRATSSIPIVFVGVAAPVRTRLVLRLARPEANLTGISNNGGELVGKWLELLRAVAPGVRSIGFMTDPDNPASMLLFGDLNDAARERGIAVRLLDGSSAKDVERSFQSLERAPVDALMTSAAATLRPHRKKIVDGVARLGVPALYAPNAFVEVGGLMSYSADPREHWRRFAEILHQVLGGKKPEEIPVELPKIFRLVVNLRTARALGLTIPQSILLQATRVIE